MAKVSLIYPRDMNLNFFPLGVGYIASFLKNSGHSVKLLDVREEEISQLSILKGDPPDIVGFSITTPQVPVASKMIEYVRKLLPSTYIVVGNIHPAYFKETYMRESNVDFIVLGEGEVTMCELCDAIDGKKHFSEIRDLIYCKDGKVIVNPPRPLIDDLDALPFPFREGVNYETYLQPPGLIRGLYTRRCANLTTSRGCPGQCNYCGVNFLFEKKYRRRSVENVLAEIDELVDRYKIDSIYFMDDTFLMNSRWILDFCEKLQNHPYRLVWSCYGRVDTVKKEMLLAAKKAGCVQVEYGIESCSNKTLKRMGKHVRVDQIKDTIQMTKDAGLRALGSFMVGFPEENEEDILDSMRCSSGLALDFVTCYFTTPYPGSDLYEQAIQEHRIIESDFSKWYVRNTNIWRVNLSIGTLEQYRAKFLKQHRLRNISFFLKKPIYVMNILMLFLRNIKAIYQASKDSFRTRSWDDFGFYFYVYMTSGQGGRNRT